MKKPFMTRTLLVCLGLVFSCAHAEDNPTSKPGTVDSAAGDPNAGVVPDYFKIDPSPEVVDAVKAAMGNISPEESAQADHAVERYEHAKQFQKEVKALADTYPVKLHQPASLQLKIVSGYESELFFFDLNGEPWDVGDVSAGNTKLLKAGKSEIMPHSVTINTKEQQYAGRTNLKVRFEGLETSISFPVLINTQEYYETLKVVLPGISPKAKQANPDFEVRRAMDDPVARAILDNPIEPDNQQKCENRFVITRTITGQTLLGSQPVAFRCETGMYIRTRYMSGASPEANGLVHGPDGYRVYRFLNEDDYYSFRTRDGRTVFVEVVKPQKLIGARFGAQVRLDQ